MKTCKEYRVESKAALSGHWGTAILISILFALISGAASATLIGAILLFGAMTVGYSFCFCKLLRTNTLEVGDLFYGFGNGIDFSATIGLAVKTAIFTFLWSCLFVIPGIVAALSYSMAPYILADHPGITGGQAIKASKQLMKGKKGRLFCLELSFIGWILLGCLTFGILFLWIEPWMMAAQADFYESIKDEVVIA